MTNFNTRFYLLAAIIYITIFGYSNLFAQQSISTLNGKRVSSNKTYPPGSIVSSIANKDSTLSTFIYDPNETVKIIVQFKTPPLAALKIQNKKLTLANIIPIQLQIENEHSLFKNDLTRIESNGIALPSSILKSADTKIKFEYKTAINGTAISTKRWVIQEIEKLSYVKAVYEDKQMKVLDDASNNVIGADSVWSKLGLTGAGIKIGILDTGIDYKHPDLGGGFGPAFKVIGGYDFINNDNDPMDDHGHGTHVAGIAAANGQLKGVAPDAKLYAFKVLDNAGNGPSSTIIAGIDRAMDPDNNPVTNDAVNIISMSLGGSGDPDDPLSQAVDNATAEGIICVIAAGNSGNYQTIGSPGCARTALTVGATDNNDGIAYFNSRGPSNKIFNIKPDILAPGVSINSDKLGGGYITYSGTSMATPHVAGCAALLLQLHPDWTPAMVKAVLMESAKDIGQDIWTQGSGRVNVLKAATANSFISPASLSLGMVDLSQSIETYVDTLTVYNFSSSTSNYSFSNEATLPTGISINFSPINLAVQPNQQNEIIVTITVNNNKLPFPNGTPAAFSFNLLATSSGSITKIPCAIMKNGYIDFEITGNDFTVYAANKSGLFYDKSINDFTQNDHKNYARMYLKPDVYEIICFFISINPYKFDWVIKESVNVNPSASVSIKQDEACYNVGTVMTDENSLPITGNPKVTVGNIMYCKKNGLSYSVMFGPQPKSEFRLMSKMSGISSNYIFDYYYSCDPNLKKTYSYFGSASNINQDRIINLLPNDLIKKNIRYQVPPGISHLSVIEWSDFSSDPAIEFTGLDSVYNALESPFIREWYSNGIPRSNFPDGGYFYNDKDVFNYNKTPFSFNNDLLLHLPSTYFMKNGVMNFSENFDFGKIDLTTTSDTLTFGLGPVHWFGKFVNSSNTIKIKTNQELGTEFSKYGTAGGLFFPFFKFQLQDAAPQDLKFYLYDKNSKIINTGNVNDFSFFEIINDYYNNSFLVSVPTADKYVLEISDTNYTVYGRSGKALLKATMDTRLQDKNPPSMKSLNIFRGNQITDFISTNQAGKIQFNITDDTRLKSTVLQYHSEADTIWRNLPITLTDSLYTAAIPDKMPDEYISLRITAVDSSGNILDFKIEPAFKFNSTNHSPVISAIQDTVLQEHSLFTEQIQASDIDGNILTYSLDINPTWLSIDSAKGIISGIPGAKDVGDTIVVVRVTDGFGGSASRKFSINVLSTNHPPAAFSLLLPKDKDTLQLHNPPLPLAFKWNTSKDIDINDSLKYEFVLSGPGVDTSVAGIKDTSLSLNIMSSMKKQSVYNWKVSVTDGAIWTASVDSFYLYTSAIISGLDNKNCVPAEYLLSQNYPNPFNPVTTINYALPKPGLVSLKVYNILGQEVAVLVNEEKKAGNYSIKFPSNNIQLSSGVYLYKIQAGDFISVKKLILLK